MLHFSKFKTFLILAVVIIGTLLALPNLVSTDIRENNFPAPMPVSYTHLTLPTILLV